VTTGIRGEDKSMSKTVYICNECEKSEPCRKTYEEWSMCEDSIRKDNSKPKKRTLREIIDARLPLPGKITEKTREITVKWAKRLRF